MGVKREVVLNLVGTLNAKTKQVDTWMVRIGCPIVCHQKTEREGEEDQHLRPSFKMTELNELVASGERCRTRQMKY